MYDKQNGSTTLRYKKTEVKNLISNCCLVVATIHPGGGLSEGHNSDSNGMINPTMDSRCGAIPDQSDQWKCSQKQQQQQ